MGDSEQVDSATVPSEVPDLAEAQSRIENVLAEYFDIPLESLDISATIADMAVEKWGHWALGNNELGKLTERLASPLEPLFQVEETPATWVPIGSLAASYWYGDDFATVHSFVPAGRNVPEDSAGGPDLGVTAPDASGSVISNHYLVGSPVPTSADFTTSLQPCRHPGCMSG